MAVIASPKVALERASETRDYEKALDIQRASASRTYAAYVKEDDLRYLFRKGTISLIKVGEEVVGLVAFLPDKEHRNLVELTNLAILPSYKRNGFGSEAWGLQLEELASQGFEYAWGVVHPDNKNSRDILKKSGFEYAGRADNYYGDGEPRLILEKSLIRGKD